DGHEAGPQQPVGVGRRDVGARWAGADRVTAASWARLVAQRPWPFDVVAHWYTVPAHWRVAGCLGRWGQWYQSDRVKSNRRPADFMRYLRGLPVTPSPASLAGCST